MGGGHSFSSNASHLAAQVQTGTSPSTSQNPGSATNPVTPIFPGVVHAYSRRRNSIQKNASLSPTAKPVDHHQPDNRKLSLDLEDHRGEVSSMEQKLKDMNLDSEFDQ